jgi:hypothetical protein
MNTFLHYKRTATFFLLLLFLFFSNILYGSIVSNTNQANSIIIAMGFAPTTMLVLTTFTASVKNTKVNTESNITNFNALVFGIAGPTHWPATHVFTINTSNVF